MPMRVRIKERRAELGMTQAELAELVKDKQPHVVRWENGQISLYKLKKVARALSCKIDDLVVSEDEPEAGKDQQKTETV